MDMPLCGSEVNRLLAANAGRVGADQLAFVTCPSSRAGLADMGRLQVPWAKKRSACAGVSPGQWEDQLLFPVVPQVGLEPTTRGF
jgi:hypothetical protein